MKDSQINEIISALKKICKDASISKPISLHEPFFSDSNALKYLKECIDTGWVSSSGQFVKRFEKNICDYTKANYSVAVSNGTVGLRLALKVLGVSFDDEVLTTSLSFVATSNSISHLGAYPHFVDIEEETLGMSPQALDQRLKEISIKKDGKLLNKQTGRKLAAILPVHVFGNPAKVRDLKIIANKWGIPLIEDAAEALGSWNIYKGKKSHCGLTGEIGVISFNGNKIITTGGGGVLITNNKKHADLARHLSTTAKLNHKWEFNHDMIGWNDRMPNLNASLGVSQIEKLEIYLKQKNFLFDTYVKTFSKIKEVEIIKPKNSNISNNWLITLKLLNKDLDLVKKQKNIILKESHKLGILLRPAWKSLNTLPMYNKCPKGNLSVTNENIFRLINLPSSPHLIKKLI